MGIPAMAAKGAAKLSRKQSSMVASWNAAKGRAEANYRAVGFGPTRTSNYAAGLAAATFPGSNPAKWTTNWSAILHYIVGRAERCRSNPAQLFVPHLFL